MGASATAIASRHPFSECKSVVQNYSVHLLKMIDPLVPPKPKELESAILIGAFLAWLGT
jgi:hypothetical protein